MTTVTLSLEPFSRARLTSVCAAPPAVCPPCRAPATKSNAYTRVAIIINETSKEEKKAREREREGRTSW